MLAESQKKIYSTAKKQKKIFNVRKLAYKQFDNEKYLKYNCSPLLKKESIQDHELERNNYHKSMEYQFQIALMSTPVYKELHQKYRQMRARQKKEKEDKITCLREKELYLQTFIMEREKLEIETHKLLKKRDQLKKYIQQLRQQRQIQRAHRFQRSRQYQLASQQELKNMIIAMRYQGGVDIDPDNMTYQELLQLQEHIGKVSKGLNDEEIKQLSKVIATKQNQEQLCSICYEHIKQGEQINLLKCKHLFHCICIKEWLINEKTCPMCKQQIVFPKKQ